jgi:hypothetical protein
MKTQIHKNVKRSGKASFPVYGAAGRNAAALRPG